MCTFSARTAGARTSFVATALVRAATFSAPIIASTEQGQGFAPTLALFLGVLDGWFRLRVARTARSFVVEADALVIRAGLDTLRIARPDVTAVEVWHLWNRVDYVAIHYQVPAGISVATCWEQGNREGLLALVRKSAALVQLDRSRTTVRRAHLGDQTVRLALLRRLLLDLALALSVGVLCGLIRDAIWLGTLAALPSTLIAAARYLHPKELELRDGIWCERRSNGELVPLRVIPKPLRPWVDGLNKGAYVPR